MATAGYVVSTPVAAMPVNIESQRKVLPSERTEGWSGQTGINFSLRSGNVFLLDAGGNLALTYIRRRHEVVMIGSSRFAAKATARDTEQIIDLIGNDDTRFVNAHLAHLRYSLTVLPWLQADGFTQLSSDEFILQQARLVLGLGPRFILFRNHEFAAVYGTGYMAEREYLNPSSFVSQPDSSTNLNWWHRWNNYLSLRLHAGELLTISATTYLQPRFDRLRDFWLLNENALTVKLTERLGLKLALTIRHDAEPPTYCASAFEEGACPSEQTITVRPTDVRIENSFAFTF